jgi:ABC-type ATPase with predicted acetyltransferase domain
MLQLLLQRRHKSKSNESKVEEYVVRMLGVSSKQMDTFNIEKSSSDGRFNGVRMKLGNKDSSGLFHSKFRPSSHFTALSTLVR